MKPPIIRICQTKKPTKQPAQPAGQTVQAARSSLRKSICFLESKGEVKFWCLTEFENKDPGDIRTQVPEWAQKETRSRAKQTFKTPVYLPLEKTSRIWPFIKAALGSLTATADLDMKKAVPLAARLSPMDRLPMETRLTWYARACVVLDFHDRLMPFWQDYSADSRSDHRVAGKFRA